MHIRPYIVRLNSSFRASC